MQLEIKINGRVYRVTTEEISQEQLRREKEQCVRKEFNVDERRSLHDKPIVKCVSRNTSYETEDSDWSIGTFVSDPFGMDPGSWNSF